MFYSSIRGRPCRDQMSKRSPSADDDDHDRFQATKSRKRSSNKGGGGGSIQSKENWSISPFVQAPSWSPHSAVGRHTQLAFPVCPPSMSSHSFYIAFHLSPTAQHNDATSQKLQELWMMVEQQALEIQRLGLGRGEVPYMSPSTDEDDGDRTKQANGARHSGQSPH